MHFSQRDSADSWLEVVAQMGNYSEFILEEVYQTEAVLPIFHCVCIDFWFIAVSLSHWSLLLLGF